MKEHPVASHDSVPPYLLSVARIAIGLLFFQHGAEKLWGFAGGRIDHDFGTMRGFAGPLEVVGGALIVIGLFTRATAFILCGEMAVAYFRSWAPRGLFPIHNGGEEAVLFCYVYLWLAAAGGGIWSPDHLLERKPSSQSLSIKQMAASWELYLRSVARIIFAFMFCLHGCRLTYGLLPALAGRRLGTTMALDTLPRLLGYWEIAGGTLLLVGLLTRPTATVSSIVAAAYFYGAASRGLWPIRNGGNEALLYGIVFAYVAVYGGGGWSLDVLARKPSRSLAGVRPV